MDINTWLTVVTIFIGILTVLPKEERTLLQLKLYKAEYVTFFITLIFIIPFLILFTSIADRLPILWYFTIPNGFKPSNIAFALFYILFLWIILRMIFLRPKARINERISSFFKNALPEMPFPQFFSLFTKYTSPELLSKNWYQYKEIILQPEFLKGLSQYRAGYVNNIWGLLENDQEFKLVFAPFLSGIHSAYYSEIKSNDGISTVSGDNSFLQSVIVTHLLKNRENGLLYMISDLSKKLIRSERGKSESIYLQPHPYVHTKGEEGYDLPLYYHIRFISLMYDTAIINKVDTHPHMHTLFGGMIEEILNNLPVIEAPVVGENPTNYHWLISEMFYAMNTWLVDFGGDHPTPEYEDGITKFDHIYFDRHSSYVDFTPSIMNFSYQALYKGVQQEKLELEFVAQKVYYGVLSEYFSHRLTAEMKVSIEENVLKNIPKEYVEEIIDLSLDEAFASNFHSFRNKQFRGSGFDQQEQMRLWNALDNYGLI